MRGFTCVKVLQLTLSVQTHTMTSFVIVRASDKRIQKDGEYSDSEDEEGRRDEVTHKSPRKKIKPGSPVANMVADAAKPEDATKIQNGAKSVEEISNVYVFF